MTTPKNIAASIAEITRKDVTCSPQAAVASTNWIAVESNLDFSPTPGRHQSDSVPLVVYRNAIAELWQFLLVQVQKLINSSRKVVALGSVLRPSKKGHHLIRTSRYRPNHESSHGPGFFDVVDVFESLNRLSNVVRHIPMLD